MEKIIVEKIIKDDEKSYWRKIENIKVGVTYYSRVIFVKDQGNKSPTKSQPSEMSKFNLIYLRSY